MSFSPHVRRFLLVAHLGSALGWLGAVTAYLVLAVVGLSQPDAQLVRGVYLGMGEIAWWVIVPACATAMITGVLQGLGSPWGLARHYWVLFKLILNVIASIALAIHLQPTDLLAQRGAAAALPLGSLEPVRLQLVIAPAAAILLLLTNLTLGVLKPRGLTSWGVRSRHSRGRAEPSASAG